MASLVQVIDDLGATGILAMCSDEARECITRFARHSDKKEMRHELGVLAGQHHTEMMKRPVEASLLAFCYGLSSAFAVLAEYPAATREYAAQEYLTDANAALQFALYWAERLR